MMREEEVASSYNISQSSLQSAWQGGSHGGVWMRMGARGAFQNSAKQPESSFRAGSSDLESQPAHANETTRYRTCHTVSICSYVLLDLSRFIGLQSNPPSQQFETDICVRLYAASAAEIETMWRVGLVWVMGTRRRQQKEKRKWKKMGARNFFGVEFAPCAPIRSMRSISCGPGEPYKLHYYQSFILYKKKQKQITCSSLKIIFLLHIFVGTGTTRLWAPVRAYFLCI